MALLVNKPAPKFSAKAVVNGQIVEGFSLDQFLGQYVFFFFYPLDFTFVCPTELIAFQASLREFEKRNVQVVACSVDSWFSHQAWLQVPQKKGGIEGVSYPLVSDFQKSIARQYHVLDEMQGLAYRGQFLIDRAGTVRHQLINDLSIGRSVEEALRTIDALVQFEKHGEVCPANWKNGQKAFRPTHDALHQYLTTV